MSINCKEPLENLLVWSAHRTKTLGTCARRYYFNHVGSWEGWDTSSPPEIQAAYRVKHLTTPELEIGNVVHEQIRLIFTKARAGQPINRATKIKIAQKLIPAGERANPVLPVVAGYDPAENIMVKRMQGMQELMENELAGVHPAR